jgi:glycosyltransferase involved in cell wall biosynthesis
MKILLENINLNSSNGPNSFAKKLTPHIMAAGHSLAPVTEAEVSLCFIESPYASLPFPRVQRLDGIYYNTRFDYDTQNRNIKRTYGDSQGVIYQSHYGKELITAFFGEHENGTVIHNGADMEAITSAVPMSNTVPGRKIWSCAASWRPHKRLHENIRYFLEHKGLEDILIVAGSALDPIQDPSIYYIGELTQRQLYSLYKASTYFLHLGFLDCCPNVVVDARACGAQVICTTSGGTQEVAGPEAVVIEEPKWNFQPLDLYSPPALNFDNKISNKWDIEYEMKSISTKYIKFLESFL